MSSSRDHAQSTTSGKGTLTLAALTADREWQNALAGARAGNPFATLCDHCMGRHPPPRHALCRHESIDALRARLGRDGAGNCTASTSDQGCSSREAPRQELGDPDQ